MQIERHVVAPPLAGARILLYAVTDQVLAAHQAHWGEANFNSEAFPGCSFAVAPEWPAENWDLPAVDWLRRNMQAAPEYPGWCRWIVATAFGRPTMIGGIGAHAPITPDCTEVEIGYSVVPAFQRQGYASEAVQLFLGWVWAHPNVLSVRAHTLPHLAASRRLLERAGFQFAGDGTEPDTVLYRLSRPG